MVPKTFTKAQTNLLGNFNEQKHNLSFTRSVVDKSSLSRALIHAEAVVPSNIQRTTTKGAQDIIGLARRERERNGKEKSISHRKNKRTIRRDNAERRRKKKRLRLYKKKIEIGFRAREQERNRKRDSYSLISGQFGRPIISRESLVQATILIWYTLISFFFFTFTEITLW